MTAIEELNEIAARESGNAVVSNFVNDRIALIARTICETFGNAEVHGHLVTTEVRVPFARIMLTGTVRGKKSGRFGSDVSVVVHLYDDERGYETGAKYVRIDAQGNPRMAAAIAVAHEVGKA